MSDKYDTHIGKILAGMTEDELWGTWRETDPLFEYTGRKCGCLTQVHCRLNAPTPELTDAIRADDRLHTSCEEIFDALESAPDYAAQVEVLWPYAEWQRRLDEMGVKA